MRNWSKGTGQSGAGSNQQSQARNALQISATVCLQTLNEVSQCLCLSIFIGSHSKLSPQLSLLCGPQQMFFAPMGQVLTEKRFHILLVAKVRILLRECGGGRSGTVARERMGPHQSSSPSRKPELIPPGTQQLIFH